MPVIRKRWRKYDESEDEDRIKPMEVRCRNCIFKGRRWGLCRYTDVGIELWTAPWRSTVGNVRMDRWYVSSPTRPSSRSRSTDLRSWNSIITRKNAVFASLVTALLASISGNGVGARGRSEVVWRQSLQIIHPGPSCFTEMCVYRSRWVHVCNNAQLTFKISNNQPFNFRTQVWLSIPGSNGCGKQAVCVELSGYISSCITECGVFPQSMGWDDLWVWNNLLHLMTIMLSYQKICDGSADIDFITRELMPLEYVRKKIALPAGKETSVLCLIQ
jgi:hypothetical protein